jgi:hypothetical protein
MQMYTDREKVHTPLHTSRITTSDMVDMVFEGVAEVKRSLRSDVTSASTHINTMPYLYQEPFYICDYENIPLMTYNCPIVVTISIPHRKL